MHDLAWRKSHCGIYGVLWFNGKVTCAHVASYELTRGPVPDGLYVLHKCDVRPCFRPDHLWLGTHLDNIADCVRKGRVGHTQGRRGEDNVGSLLTTQKVIEIRARYVRGNAPSLGREYGVHEATILGVVHRRSWKHVP